jgi:catechol 2,3-dioxygenase-like lactoylglutathione lyase family enzyme
VPPNAATLTFFCSADLDRSRAFYEGTLGLRPAMTTPTALLWHVAQGSYFGVTSGEGRVPKAGAAILELVVDAPGDVDDWYAAITRDGWSTDGAPRDLDGGGRCFFATDPDGYLVEVLHLPQLTAPAPAPTTPGNSAPTDPSDDR